MHRNLLFPVFILCLFSFNAFSYENQGTTVKQDGCDVIITLQIAIESDSEAADVAMIQAALAPCWSIVCDLPCSDGSVGKCKVISRLVIKKWSELSDADKPKFHHVHIIAGAGTSEVDELLPPNSGKSTGGTWRRNTYSPKVYCHETMHLAGLPDRYRDCRPGRLGVDNCKDGKQCDSTQKAQEVTPACDGFEDDVMGTDVRKPFDCNRNIVEIIRQINDKGQFGCPDECCVKEHHTAYRPVDSTPSWIFIDGGYANYHFKDETQTENFAGFNFSVGYNHVIPVTDKADIVAQAKINYSSISKDQTSTYNYLSGSSSSTGHTTYHLIIASISANGELKLSDISSIYIGPQFGLVLSDKYRSHGTIVQTVGGNTSTIPFGDMNFHKNTYKQNVQFGINLGATRKINRKHKVLKSYVNVYLPLTNIYKPTSGKLTNKLYEFNIGGLYPLNLNKRK